MYQKLEVTRVHLKLMNDKSDSKSNLRKKKKAYLGFKKNLTWAYKCFAS
jgi:hypothetical protein